MCYWARTMGSTLTALAELWGTMQMKMTDLWKGAESELLKQSNVVIYELKIICITDMGYS